jgi:hypothetical protein
MKNTGTTKAEHRVRFRGLMMVCTTIEDIDEFTFRTLQMKCPLTYATLFYITDVLRKRGYLEMRRGKQKSRIFTKSKRFGQLYSKLCIVKEVFEDLHIYKDDLAVTQHQGRDDI